MRGSQQSHANAIKTIALGVLVGRILFRLFWTCCTPQFVCICRKPGFAFIWSWNLHLICLSFSGVHFTSYCSSCKPKHRHCSCYKCRFSISLIALKRRHLTAWIFGTGCNKYLKESYLHSHGLDKLGPVAVLSSVWTCLKVSENEIDCIVLAFSLHCWKFNEALF